MVSFLVESNRDPRPICYSPLFGDGWR